MQGLLFLFLIAAAYWFYFLPVRIARARDIPPRQQFLVFWLTIFGFLGITWLLALVMACSPYPAEEKWLPEEKRPTEIIVKQSRADQLVKLSELKKDGFLTDEEFEREKDLLT